MTAPNGVYTTKHQVDHNFMGCVSEKWWSQQGQGLLPTGPPRLVHFISIRHHIWGIPGIHWCTCASRVERYVSYSGYKSNSERVGGTHVSSGGHSSVKQQMWDTQHWVYKSYWRNQGHSTSRSYGGRISKYMKVGKGKVLLYAVYAYVCL